MKKRLKKKLKNREGYFRYKNYKKYVWEMYGVKTDLKKAFEGNITELHNLMKIYFYGMGFLEMMPKNFLDQAIEIGITSPIAQPEVAPISRGATKPYICDAEFGVISGGKECGSNESN